MPRLPSSRKNTNNNALVRLRLADFNQLSNFWGAV